MAESLIDVLRRREVVTTDPAEARQCCGIDRDEDGFCQHRPGHPIYVGPRPDLELDDERGLTP